MRKVLVLRGGALGDFLVTLPALRLLRQRWPEARLELAGNATAAALGREEGLVDAVHSQHEARWSTLYNAAPLPADFAEWLRGFDLVVSYWPDPDGDLRRRFPLHDEQRFVAGAAMPTRAPAAAHYCAVLNELGLRTVDVQSRLSIRPSSASSTQRTRPRVAVHPGSGSPRKNWPLERWEQVCAWLRNDRGAELLIVSGEADPGDVLKNFDPHARNFPLPKLASALADCDLFLGHDSGVSHLAAAVGTRCLLLFGPTDPSIWAPPGDHVQVLQKGPTLNEIRVADVIAALGHCHPIDDIQTKRSSG